MQKELESSGTVTQVVQRLPSKDNVHHYHHHQKKGNLLILNLTAVSNPFFIMDHWFILANDWIESLYASYFNRKVVIFKKCFKIFLEVTQNKNISAKPCKI
jgi:hypothetical protein